MARKQEPENATTTVDATATDPPDSLPGKLAALGEMNEQHLRVEWRRLYRREPPRLSRDLLIRGVAYRLQEMACGGLNRATRRKLAAFAKQLETEGHLNPAPMPRLRPGARLVREWRGRTHVVMVVHGGFEFAGQTYPSLSKVAEAITGVHWSGPRFFGIGTGKAAPPPAVDDTDGASFDAGEPANV